MALDNGTIRTQGARPLCIPLRGSTSSRLRESPSRESIPEDAAILHSGERGEVMAILRELREHSSQIMRKLMQDDVIEKKTMVPRRVQVISSHGLNLNTLAKALRNVTTLASTSVLSIKATTFLLGCLNIDIYYM